MFFNSRTLGFLMAVDEDDKKDEEIWDGDVLSPYRFDDFDDDPYDDLRELLSRNIQTGPSSMLSSSGSATSDISICPVIANSDNSYTVQEGKQSSKLVDEVSTASVEPDKPPDITSIPGDSSDPLANIIESLGIGIFESDVEQVIAEVAKEETETSETQQCENISPEIQQCENISPMGEDVTSEIQQCENISPMVKAVTSDSESQQCENISADREAVIYVSDDDGEKVPEDTSKLLDYMSICENIILVYEYDYLTLRPNTYVSDPIVNFYLDYIHRRKLPPALQKDVYIFPSHFYQVLSTSGTVLQPPVNVFDKGCKYNKKMQLSSCYYNDTFSLPNQHLPLFYIEFASS